MYGRYHRLELIALHGCSRSHCELQCPGRRDGNSTVAASVATFAHKGLVMLCAFEVALTIMGVMAIFKQKLQMTKGRVVTGVPAILTGILMAGTIPLVFVFAFVI